MPSQDMHSRILDYFAKHPQASSRELARELAITKSGVRYHLSQLEKQGFIERVNAERGNQENPGRPHQVFRLCAGKKASNLSELAKALLERYEPAAEDSRAEFYRSLAETLIPHPTLPSSLNAQHLNQFINFLNERHYSSRWEAHRNGPRIVLHNCPYASIWQAHPSICLIDQYLISRWTGADALQTAHMFLSPSKGTQCIFQLYARHQPKR